MRRHLHTILGILVLFDAILIVETPVFISRPFGLFEEEILETGVLILLLLIGGLLLYSYQQEIMKRQRELNDTLIDIGGLNVRLDYLQAAFKNISRYPETRRDMKAMIAQLAQQALGIVPDDWIAVRVLNPQTKRIIAEHVQPRRAHVKPSGSISNKELLETNQLDGYVTVFSRPENFSVAVYLVLPGRNNELAYAKLLKPIAEVLAMLTVIASAKNQDIRTVN